MHTFIHGVTGHRQLAAALASRHVTMPLLPTIPLALKRSHPVSIAVNISLAQQSGRQHRHCLRQCRQNYVQFPQLRTRCLPPVPASSASVGSIASAVGSDSVSGARSSCSGAYECNSEQRNRQRVTPPTNPLARVACGGRVDIGNCRSISTTSSGLMFDAIDASAASPE